MHYPLDMMSIERSSTMITAHVSQLELFEAWTESEGTGVRASFPLSAAAGTKSTTVVYFEVEPGKRLPVHTDSAEEILYVVSGRGLATVGEETVPVDAGALAVVPALVPHGVENVGDEPLRVVGFFSSNTMHSEFEETLLPFGTRNFIVPPVEVPVAA
jgi:quercetin dioxygenase-like cupin family protein